MYLKTIITFYTKILDPTNKTFEINFIYNM